MIKCTKCASPLDADIYNKNQLSPCPNCGVPIRVDAFPALLQNVTPGENGERLILDDDAGCYYHPDKKAVIACESCGRFLCALCDLEMHGRHLCAACLETGTKTKSIKTLETRRTLYDNMALHISIVSLLFWFFSFITAPVVIYLVVRHWRSQSSIMPRTKIRFMAAFLIAGLQIAAWSWGVYALIRLT